VNDFQDRHEDYGLNFNPQTQMLSLVIDQVLLESGHEMPIAKVNDIEMYYETWPRRASCDVTWILHVGQVYDSFIPDFKGHFQLVLYVPLNKYLTQKR